MTEKKFHVGDILSVATKTNLSPRGLYGAINLLNFMFGGDKHELPCEEVFGECRDSIFAQYPQFALPEMENAMIALAKYSEGVPDKHLKQVTGLWLQRFISGEFGIQCEKMMPIKAFSNCTRFLLQKVNY